MKPQLRAADAAILRAFETVVHTVLDDPYGEKTIIVVEDLVHTPWASLTYDGRHHRLTLRTVAAEARHPAVLAALATALEALDPGPHGDLIAEIGIVGSAVLAGGGAAGAALLVDIEALTIAD